MATPCGKKNLYGTRGKLLSHHLGGGVILGEIKKRNDKSFQS